MKYLKRLLLTKKLIAKLDEVFPEKIRKVSSDDQPWITHKIKLLDRRRKRIFHKQRRSEKWAELDKQFKKEVKAAKAKFYENSVKELKTSNPRRWYSTLKKITKVDKGKSEDVIVDEIAHLPDKVQADMIAKQFAAIQNEYTALKKEDIVVPNYSESEVPQFQVSEVWRI